MLKQFLEEKPLYYNEIDYSRMPRVYEKVKKNFTPTTIIHLVGTNAKGTTGRFLATALYNRGFKVGHYTSPHILDFNERIWLNGNNADNQILEEAHNKLQNILSKNDSNSLSYFEYTTLLAMLVFNGCDYVVLEAGLGGEYDATAVFEKELTLVTPIDFDHEAFLGTTIEEIATTKMNAICKNAILAPQKFEDVYSVANNIAIKKDANIFRVNELVNRDDEDKIKIISKNLNLVAYLEENLRTSISALNFLDIKYDIQDFNNARLFGRLSKINDNIIVDVGHNPLAAKSIANSLDGQKFVVIYNSYKDKDYTQILKILKPIILHVEIIEINDKRVESKEVLQSTLKELKIKYSSFKQVRPDIKYLVFGSFSVVEEFLKVHNE